MCHVKKNWMVTIGGEMVGKLIEKKEKIKSEDLKS
jgi:hypothetical protein